MFFLYVDAVVVAVVGVSFVLYQHFETGEWREKEICRSKVEVE